MTRKTGREEIYRPETEEKVGLDVADEGLRIMRMTSARTAGNAFQDMEGR